jgi:hypothetical protein
VLLCPLVNRSSSGGKGNSCTTQGPYKEWTDNGSMVKIDTTDGSCDQQATFYIKATLTTLVIDGGTLPTRTS